MMTWKKLYESGVFNSDHSKTLLNKMFFEIMLCFCRHGRQNLRQLKKDDFTGAPNGSVPQNICSIGTFLLAGRCGRNNSPWKESVAGKKIIQGVRGNLKSRIAAAGYLYGLLTTQDLNCALWNFPVSQVAGCKVAGWELFHQSCWEWWTDNFFFFFLLKCLK